MKINKKKHEILKYCFIFYYLFTSIILLIYYILKKLKLKNYFVINYVNSITNYGSFLKLKINQNTI